MKVSREFAIAELEQVRKILAGWIRDLKTPTGMSGTGTVPLYPEGVPEGLSVDSVQGIPAQQLQAELVAIAGKLEALAAT
jgi:hypothetical protein